VRLRFRARGINFRKLLAQDRPIRSCGCLYCEVTGTRAPYADYSAAPLAPRGLIRTPSVSLIFQPIPKPAVNDLPLLVVNRTEIEKIRLFFL
jgi:hypothetical protein